MVQINSDITLFILTILTIESSISSLLTEAIKRYAQNNKLQYATNVIALIVSFIVGVHGTTIIYILGGVEWNITTITVLICMIPMVWIGSMIGFDKVRQTLVQISNLTD